MSKLLNKLGILKTPWKVSGCYSHIIISDDEKMLVADCTINHYKERHKPQHTRIMAAAPGMLEALIHYIINDEKYYSTFGAGIISKVKRNEYKKALEKATGKTWDEIKELLDER